MSVMLVSSAFDEDPKSLCGRVIFPRRFDRVVGDLSWFVGHLMGRVWAAFPAVIRYHNSDSMVLVVRCNYEAVTTSLLGVPPSLITPDDDDDLGECAETVLPPYRQMTHQQFHQFEPRAVMQAVRRFTTEWIHIPNPVLDANWGGIGAAAVNMPDPSDRIHTLASFVVDDVG